MNAAWMFSNTVSLGKMLTRWKERPRPRRQMSWGARPVTSRPSKMTAPASGLRWPVIRLKNVVLPAPLGPMIAAISPPAIRRLTPATAWKPSNDFRTSRTSSNRGPPEAEHGGVERAHDAAREAEQQHDQDRAEDERPVFRVGRDLLVQHVQHERTDGRTPEVAGAAEDRHDQDLGRFGPVREVGKDAAVEDPEEPARESRERAREHEDDELVAADVHADELRALGVLADRGQHPAEG